MSPVILTLQVPKGSRGIPVATTANADLLSRFRRVVLAESERRVYVSEDEVEALLARLELERLARALAVLIPDDLVPEVEDG